MPRENRVRAPRIRCWEAYLAVAALGTVTAAGESLGLTQPAVSRMLRELEQDLGRALFARSGQTLSLTELGLALRPEAERVVAAFYELSMRARSHVDSASPLRLSCVPAVSMGLVPEALCAIGAEELAGLCIETETAERAQASVVEGRSHFAVTSAPLLFGELACHWLMAAACVAVLPADHALACDDRPIALEELLCSPFIAMTRARGTGARIREKVLRAVPDARIGCEANSVLTAMALVRRGLGVTVIDPVSAFTARPEGVVVRPLASELTYSLAFVGPHGQAPKGIARKLCNLMQDILLTLLPDARLIAPSRHREFLLELG